MWRILQNLLHPGPCSGIRPVAGAYTHTGLVLQKNEDNYLIVRLPGRTDLLAAVADGLGGLEAGDLASIMAVESVLRNRLRRLLSSDLSSRTARRLVAEIIREANDEIFRVNSAMGSTPIMGTTLTVGLFLESGLVVIGHVGDSRCYCLRDGVLRQITADHTLVAELAARGKIPRSSIAKHPLSHVLLQCLGSRPQVSVSVHSEQCAPGDRFLLCTDGVSSFLPDQEIAASLRRAPTPAEAAKDIVGRSMAAGSVDNVTALAVFCCSCSNT